MADTVADLVSLFHKCGDLVFGPLDLLAEIRNGVETIIFEKAIFITFCS